MTQDNAMSTTALLTYKDGTKERCTYLAKSAFEDGTNAMTFTPILEKTRCGPASK